MACRRSGVRIPLAPPGQRLRAAPEKSGWEPKWEPSVTAPAMSRRGFRDDAVYFDHSGDCRDARYHKGCPGRWRGAVSLGYGPDGKRIRRKVGGRTKQEVKDKLEELHADLTAGIAAPDGRYTVGQATEDWLRDDLDGRAAKTLTLHRGALKPFADHIGKKPLRELTAQDVRGVLTDLAATHSSRTVVVAHNAIERAIRHAEANNYVRRNVASLVRPPSGQPGRPSKSLTFDQANVADGRCRRIAAWRLRGAVPADRDPGRGGQGPDAGSTSTSTEIRPRFLRCRRTWPCGAPCVLTATPRPRSPGARCGCPSAPSTALREHRARQAEQRLLAGELWQDQRPGVQHLSRDSAGRGQRAPGVQEDHDCGRARRWTGSLSS